MISATAVNGKFNAATHSCRGILSWKLTSAIPASVSPKTIALKQKRMMMPNQKRSRNEMIYFDHQWGSSRTPCVCVSDREMVAMKTVPK